MSILELLSMVMIMCSNPENGCRVVENNETNVSTYVVCVESDSRSKLPSIELGVIDMNNPDKYRYITIQPISCTEV